MLICLWTGRKPNKRTYEMICYYFLGLASEQELRNHLGELPAQEFPYNTAKVTVSTNKPYADARTTIG